MSRSCCSLRCLALFHLFLLELSPFLSLNALLDFLFELFLLASDLLQLSSPLGLQVWILKQQDHQSDLKSVL